MSHKEKTLKRLLVLVLFCVTARLYAQDVDAAAEQTAVKERPNFFVRGWNIFLDGLLAPQIHKPFSVLGGIEFTQNDRANMLPEVYIAADYEFTRYIGFGVRGGMTFGSRQPQDSLVSVMEGVMYGRFYAYDFGWIRPFLQGGLGISLNREQEYEYTDVLGEMAVGLRAYWKGWFLETSCRYGFPFRVAAGLGVGHCFLP